MNVALRRPMTRQEFFAWAEARDEPYEFDGVQPVAMTGGNLNHAMISRNLNARLFLALGSGRCQSIPSEAGGGVATVGQVVRYPDAVVTCSAFAGRDRLIPEPVVVFEVLSPASRYMDLVVKPAEYAEVASIRRYVVIEQISAEVRVYARAEGGAFTEAILLGPGDDLDLPEIGISLPVAQIYERVTFEDGPPTA